jgi:hypothetical protein
VLILLDKDGVVIDTLDYDPVDAVVTADDRVFEYEDRDGDDHIYREVE